MKRIFTNPKEFEKNALENGFKLYSNKSTNISKINSNDLGEVPKDLATQLFTLDKLKQTEPVIYNDKIYMAVSKGRSYKKNDTNRDIRVSDNYKSSTINLKSSILEEIIYFLKKDSNTKVSAFN